jgi:hypothetical protein
MACGAGGERAPSARDSSDADAADTPLRARFRTRSSGAEE